MIELPAQGAAERLDARRLPMGEIGEGAVFDFTVLAVGLAKENGGRGVAVGDGGDVHVDLIQLQISLVKEIINNYMSTNPTKKEIQLQHQSRLTQNLGEEDPSERSEESAFSSFRPISNFSPRTNTRLLPHALFPRLS